MFLRLIYTDIAKHPNLNGYRDIGERQTWSCSATSCMCLTWCVIYILHMGGYELITKASHMEASVLCKVLGT